MGLVNFGGGGGGGPNLAVKTAKRKRGNVLSRCGEKPSRIMTCLLLFWSDLLEVLFEAF